MLRYLTGGESHGKGLFAIIEGVPAGIKLDIDEINKDLSLRQKGYGRGGRMKIESDKCEILSGVRNSYTLASPITLKIENKDYTNWESIMDCEIATDERKITNPRPGHADLVGGMKYNHGDLRNVLERSSARQTAIRVAVGSVCRQILNNFGMEFYTRCVSIGDVVDEAFAFDKESYLKAKNSCVGFSDKKSEQKAIELIDRAKKNGESVGGVAETTVINVPPGLGSYTEYDRKLDANIAFGVMSIHAVKGVEIGLGFEASRLCGSMVQDSIYYNNGYYRKTNNAGGIEGGMSNGEPIVVRCAMKPIPTQYNPLDTVNIETKNMEKASVERSDTCAVYACGTVMQSVVAFELCKAFLDKFSSDCYNDLRTSYDDYINRIKNF